MQRLTFGSITVDAVIDGELGAPLASMLQAERIISPKTHQPTLSLANNAYQAVVQALMQRTFRLVVTGGGGYNPWTVDAAGH